MTRPRSDRTDVMPTVRVTPEERQAIEAAAGVLGVTYTEAVRMLPAIIKALAKARRELNARAGG